ncbi:MAG: amidohydrolase/deacetylase family metallohydrolase [Bacilli bacterium]
MDVLIITNGYVICPVTRTISEREVVLINGLIANREDISSDASIVSVDAGGAFVSPGWIDLHVHVYPSHTELGVEPDLVGIYEGVTTVVDAGSSGCQTYAHFYNQNVKASVTEVLAFVNVSRDGLTKGLSELSDPNRYMTSSEWEELRMTYDNIVGIKARMSRSVVCETGVTALTHARRLADVARCPIMVHIGNAPPNLSDVIDQMNKGDIITHAFHGKKGGTMDEAGNLIPSLQRALQRGVKLDVGHGTSSFSYKIMRKFKKHHNVPYTISTDVYKGNRLHPVGNLSESMTKMYALGYSLIDVVASVTYLASQSVARSEIGSWELGTRGDVTIFKLVSKEGKLTDSEGETIVVSEQIIPILTIREGKVVARLSTDEAHKTHAMREMFERSGYAEQAELLYLATQSKLNEVGLKLSESGKLALCSHLSAMVRRSNEREELPTFDTALFHEISDASLALARDVVALVPYLGEEEVYLLSVHFECASMNVN